MTDPTEIERLRELAAELASHLKALCEHPVNFARRYDLVGGGPCTGCFDALYEYQEWLNPSTQADLHRPVVIDFLPPLTDQQMTALQAAMTEYAAKPPGAGLLIVPNTVRSADGHFHEILSKIRRKAR